MPVRGVTGAVFQGQSSHNGPQDNTSYFVVFYKLVDSFEHVMPTHNGSLDRQYSERMFMSCCGPVGPLP